MWLINIVLSAFIIVCVSIYMGSCFLKKRPIFKAKNVIISFILIPTVITLSFYSFENIIRIFINYFSIALVLKVNYEETTLRSLLLSIFIFIYFLLAELIFSLAAFFFIGDLSKDFAGNILINLEIGALVLLLMRFKTFNVFIQTAIEKSNKINSYSALIILIIVIAVIANRNFLLSGLLWEHMLNLILLITFNFIVYLFLKEKEHSIQLSMRYDQLFNYLQKYEKAFQEKKMLIHEFKNQIIAIKGFLGNQNQEALNYINSIIEDFNGYGPSVLNDMDKMPNGGLKGLIYYKLGDLEAKGVDVYINVAPAIPVNLFKNFKPNLYKDLIKIMGVYLDNAVEGVQQAKKKQIVLEVYYKNKELHYILTNTYQDNFKKIKLADLGYTTKAKGRGYGLGLANKLVNRHKIMRQTCKITPEYYIVELILDFKKHPF